MANICITLPKSTKWSDYEKELDKVKDGKEEMNFRLPTLPRDVHPGDRCYVCHDGFVKGWMEITNIGKRDGFDCSTTGKQWNDGIYVSRSGEFHYLDKPIPMKGFQGYRKMDNLNEAFNTNFRLEELNNIKDFNEKLKYCQEHLGPMFGEGSSRIVFDFTDEAVFKLAYNEKGVAQNKNEYTMASKSPVVVKCFDVAPDYTWIIQENVLPVEEGDFEECLGLSWGEFQEFVVATYKTYTFKDCPYYAMEYDDYEYYMERSQNSWWFKQMFEYMVKFLLPIGDLIRLSTYGMVKRDGKPQIVVLDSGLTEEVLNKFYRNKTVNEETIEEEVSIEPFEPKDELNPKFWVDNKLNSKVRMRLLDIADDFVKNLNIRWVKPDDIVLTGSIANYNWTKFSDVDIHIIMDFSKVYKKTDFVKSYFDAKKEEWNGSHEGLKIYGFNVELSVEDKNAPAVASGVYSLEKNDWVSEPKDLSDAKLNKEYVESTAESYIDKIDDLDRRIRKEKDAKKVETLSNKMVSIFNKLKGMRKEGLKSKSKEMSSGNIIWKILRAEGYIKKIWDIVNYNYDRSMSLNEGYWGYLPLQNDYILDDLHELADENITPLVKELDSLYKSVSKKDATPIEKTNVITSTDDNGKEEKEERKYTTSERKEGLQEIFQLVNKIIYLIWSAAEWGPSRLEKEGIDVKKLLNDCIDLLDDKVWIDEWKEPSKEMKSHLKKLKHWVELIVDQPYDKGKERYDQIQVGKDLGFLHELDEAVTGTDNKKVSALYVYAFDKEKECWCVLCAKRVDNGDDSEGGKWNPPMGHVHRGEDMLDGAIRECLEESGLDVKEYKTKVHLKDSHRWGNNYRLVIKDKTIDELELGEGDEENEKFIWCPIQYIKDKTWAYSCRENAEKYAPKTITLTESQRKVIREMGEVITLYHGVSSKDMEFNMENGGFTPRVCAEGGPKAVWLSEKQYDYDFTFKFEFPKVLLGKKLIQQSTVDYTFDDFIPFNSFNCELVKTNFIQHGDSFSVIINLKNIEMCRNQARFMPEIYHAFNNRMKEFPMIYDEYVSPVMQELGIHDDIHESKRTIIVNESQLEGLMPNYGTRYLNSYLKKFRERTGLENLKTSQLHDIMRLLNFNQKQDGCYKIEDINYVLDRPDVVRKMLGLKPKEVEKLDMQLLPDTSGNKPDYTPPLSIMKNASKALLKKDGVFGNNEVNEGKNDVKKLPFEKRAKLAMDQMMHNSTSIGMAVAAFCTDANDAIRMMKYIKDRLC